MLDQQTNIRLRAVARARVVWTVALVLAALWLVVVMGTSLSAYQGRTWFIRQLRDEPDDTVRLVWRWDEIELERVRTSVSPPPPHVPEVPVGTSVASPGPLGVTRIRSEGRSFTAGVGLSAEVRRSDVLRIPTATAALPAVAVLAASVVALRRLRRRHRSASNLCVRCAYDLRDTPRRCPECGTYVYRRAGK